MHLPTQLQTNNSETIETNMLLDSGTGGVFIDENFAKNKDYPSSLFTDLSNARTLMEPLIN